MKEVKAVAKNVRGSARKARIPAAAVRGMRAEKALDVLKYMPRRAAHDVRKVVASAVANAVHNEGMESDKLIISKIHVDEAFTMKRYRPESKGRVRAIMKRNSNITVYVTDGAAEESKTKEVKAEKKSEEKKTESKKVESKKAEPKKKTKPAAKKAAAKKETKSTKSKPSKTTKK